MSREMKKRITRLGEKRRLKRFGKELSGLTSRVFFA